MLFFTEFRRRRLKRAPFPPEWLAILENHVELYRRLPESDRVELQGHVQVFLAEKQFEGGGGFAVTDTVRLVVAAQACLLLLHRDGGYYPGLSSIIVYPDEYLAPLVEVDEAGIVTEGTDRRSGEFVMEGALVLSWADVTGEGLDVHGAYNVVLHEFAHQLDAEQGITVEPAAGGRHEVLYRVLARECRQLRREVRRGHSTFLDPYGTGNLAEFFAVATEAFFETPAEFRSAHPELYQELVDFYRQDPGSWNTLP